MSSPTKHNPMRGGIPTLGMAELKAVLTRKGKGKKTQHHKTPPRALEIDSDSDVELMKHYTPTSANSQESNNAPFFSPGFPKASAEEKGSHEVQQKLPAMPVPKARKTPPQLPRRVKDSQRRAVRPLQLKKDLRNQSRYAIDSLTTEASLEESSPATKLRMLQNMVENKAISKRTLTDVTLQGYLSFQHNVITDGKWKDYYCLYNMEAREISFFRSRMDFSEPVGILGTKQFAMANVMIMNRKLLKITGVTLEDTKFDNESNPSEFSLILSPHEQKTLLLWKDAFKGLGCSGRRSSVTEIVPSMKASAGSDNFDPDNVPKTTPTKPKKVKPARPPMPKTPERISGMLAAESPSRKDPGQRPSSTFSRNSSSFKRESFKGSLGQARPSSPWRINRKEIMMRQRPGTPSGASERSSSSKWGLKISSYLNGLLAKRKTKEELEEMGVLKVSQMFGVPISKCRRKHGIPEVLFDCVEALHKNGLEEEGIFRVPGAFAEIASLKKIYDFESDGKSSKTALQNANVNAVAGVLKQFLREMPEPLLTFELYPKLIEMARKRDFNGMMPLVKSTLEGLNLLNFNFLFHFLKEATFYSNTSRMNASNIALVFAPNILRPEKETLQSLQSDAKEKIDIVETLIHATKSEEPKPSLNLHELKHYNNLFEEGDELDSQSAVQFASLEDYKTKNRFGEPLENTMKDEKNGSFDFYELLTEGNQFKKKKTGFGRSNQKRVVWVNANLTRVIWSEKEHTNIHGWIDSTNIAEVSALDKFTLRIVTTTRTLDLEAQSEYLKDRWILALLWLKKQAQQSVARFLVKLTRKKFREDKLLAAKAAIEALQKGTCLAKYKTKVSSKLLSRLLWCDSKLEKITWSEASDRKKIRNRIDMADICSVMKYVDENSAQARYTIVSPKKVLELGDLDPSSDPISTSRQQQSMLSRQSLLSTSSLARQNGGFSTLGEKLDSDGGKDFMDALTFYLNHRDVFFTPGEKYYIFSHTM